MSDELMYSVAGDVRTSGAETSFPSAAANRNTFSCPVVRRCRRLSLINDCTTTMSHRKSSGFRRHLSGSIEHQTKAPAQAHSALRCGIGGLTSPAGLFFCFDVNAFVKHV